MVKDQQYQTLADTAVEASDPHLQPEFMADLIDAIRADRSDVVLALVDNLLPADIADVLEALSPRQRGALVDLVGDKLEAEVLTEVEGEARDQMLDLLPTEQIAEAVLELESDDAIDVLEDMDLAERDQVLASIEDS